MAGDPHQAAKRPSKKLVLALSALLAIAIGASVFLFFKYQHETDTNPVKQQQRLTDELSRLVEMPRDKPVISTVLDRSKLSNKTLASRAHDGDVLFIFPKSKRLILYRPSDDKVVDMLNIRR